MLWKHTVVNCAQTLRSFKEICRVSPWFFRGWGLCYVRGLKLSIAQTRIVWLTFSTSFSQSSNPHPSPFTTTIPRLTPHGLCGLTALHILQWTLRLPTPTTLPLLLDQQSFYDSDSDGWIMPSPNGRNIRIVKARRTSDYRRKIHRLLTWACLGAKMSTGNLFSLVRFIFQFKYLSRLEPNSSKIKQNTAKRWNPTQLCRDYFINRYKDPNLTNQRLFQHTFGTYP